MNQLPYIIAIDGPSGSGKSTVTKFIRAALEMIGLTVTVINCDRFYRNARKDENPDTRNYDIPDAFDFVLMHNTLEKLVSGESINVVKYDYTTHSRMSDMDRVVPGDIIIFEGILVYHWTELRKWIRLPIYMDVKQEECLMRRTDRDIIERGRTRESVFKQFRETVGPSFDTYIAPLKKIIAEDGGIVIPKGGKNAKGFSNVIGRIGMDLGLDLGELKEKLRDSSLKFDN